MALTWIPTGLLPSLACAAADSTGPGPAGADPVVALPSLIPLLLSAWLLLAIVAMAAVLSSVREQ